MRLYLSIILLSVGLLTLAQSKIKVSETNGKPFRQRAMNIEDIYELPSGGYWSITSRRHGGGPSGTGFLRFPLMYDVQKYDESLNLIVKKKLNLRMYDKHLDFKQVVKFKGEYYIFLTFDNVKKKKKYLFYALFDQYDMRIDGDLTKVAEIGLGSKSSRTTDGSFDISVSDNQKFVMVIGNEPQRLPQRSRLFGRSSKKSTNNEGNHTFRFTYWVLDENFQIVNYNKKHELRIENSSDKFYVRDLRIDNDGALYILGKNKVMDEYTNTVRKFLSTKEWTEVKRSAFVLQKINPDGSTEMRTSPDGELFVDMNLLFDKEGRINLIGLTGEQVYSSLVTTGLFRGIYDQENLDEVSVVSGKFEPEVLKQVNDIQERQVDMSERRKRKIERRKERRERRMTKEEKAMEEARERAALNVNYIAYSGLDDAGDAVVVLEEQHLEIVTTTTTDANGVTTTTTTYYYHYDDLIIAKFIDDDIKQNYYKKSYVSVNVPLINSTDVVVKDGEINIMTQGHIVRTDIDLENVMDYELKSFSRSGRTRGLNRKLFRYRKAIDEDTLLAAAQSKRKMVWYKIKVK